MVGVHVVQPNKGFLLMEQVGPKTLPVFHGECFIYSRGFAFFLIHFKFLCGLVVFLEWGYRTVPGMEFRKCLCLGERTEKKPSELG